MSDPQWNSIVKRKLRELLPSIRTTELLDQLLADDILSTEEYEILSNVVSRESQTTANRKLLISILPRKPPGTFDRFLRALQSIPEQTFVAEILMSTDTSQAGVSVEPSLGAQGTVPGSAAAERYASSAEATAAEHDDSLPPIAGAYLVRTLPEKLVRQLAEMLDHTSATDCDWRGLFADLQQEYGGVFSTGDVDLYKHQYQKINGSPTRKLLQDFGTKTEATAQALCDVLRKMKFKSACTLMRRYFTEHGDDWQKDLQIQTRVHTLSLDRPCHDVLLREKELEAIKVKFTELQGSDVRYVYVTGPPACGKTELVRQYVECVVRQWKAQDITGYQRAVFMAGTLKGGSMQEFDESLQKLAQSSGCSRAAEYAVNISNIDGRLMRLSENLKYQMKSFKEWLLVVDDLTSSTYRETTKYWPVPGTDDWGKGRVLITTNNRSMVPCSNSQVKELKLSHSLRPIESVCLLQLISGCGCENVDGAAQLAAQLDYNPLSLASAAIFVKEAGESWYSYMDQLGSNIQSQCEEILAEKQQTYPRTLRAAIKLALKKMMEGNNRLKSALEMIAVCSQQHPLPVVVAQAFLNTCHRQSLSASRTRTIMIQCSLILVSEDNIRVHSATHDSLNEVWESRTSREQTAAIVLKVLVQQSNLEQHPNKAQLLLLPHLLHILSHDDLLPHNEETDIITAEAWMLCCSGIDALGSPCRVGKWLDKEDSLQQQRECVEMALELYKKMPNEPHVEFTEAYLQLADILNEMYQQDNALECAKSAVELAQSLPDKPLLTAQSLKTLGQIRMDKGENDQAMELFQQSMHIYITSCGYESLHVASLLTKLGRLYHDYGQNDRAKTSYEDSIRICVHVTEREGLRSSPLLAATFANLGRAYLEPGYIDAEKAIHLLQQSLTARRHIYGSDHPISALTRTALGRAYLVNQQPHTAEVELREALRIQQLMLHGNHPDKAITLNILGNVQRQRGNWEEAVHLLQQSLDIRLTNFGPDHHDIGYCKNDLGMAMLGIDKAADALRLLKDAVRIKRAQFGPHHIEVAITYGCISDAYRVLGNKTAADEYSDKHAEIMKQQTDSDMATAFGQL